MYVKVFNTISKISISLLFNNNYIKIGIDYFECAKHGFGLPFILLLYLLIDF